VRNSHAEKKREEKGRKGMFTRRRGGAEKKREEKACSRGDAENAEKKIGVRRAGIAGVPPASARREACGLTPAA